MTSEIIFNFTPTDPRARFTMNGNAYRALTIRRDQDGALSTDVVLVNKRTGEDWKRESRFVWFTVEHSLQRWAPEFAEVLLIIVEELDRAEMLNSVREFYGDTAWQLVNDGWTVDNAIDHVTGQCDILICTGEHGTKGGIS